MKRTHLAIALILAIIGIACGSMEESRQTDRQDAATATATPLPEATSEPEPTSAPESTPEQDADRIAGNHCTDARRDGEQEILRIHPDGDEVTFRGFQMDSVSADGKHRMLIVFLEPTAGGGQHRGIARFSVNSADCAIKLVEVKY